MLKLPLLIISIFLLGGNIAVAQVLEWHIVLDRDTHQCSVVRNPTLSANQYSFGSFDTSDRACQSACEYFDETQSNSNKCFDYTTDTRNVCPNQFLPASAPCAN
jgi:hypothetical protein